MRYMERTLVLIKPDAIEKRISGLIWTGWITSACK